MKNQKKLVKKALKYIKLIEQSKYYQSNDIDFLGMSKFDDFLGLKEFRQKRVSIHEKMQNKMQNRVNNLLKQSLNEN